MWWQHVWQKFSITDILMAEEMQILRSFPSEFEFSSHSPYFCWSQKSQTYDFKDQFFFPCSFPSASTEMSPNWWNWEMYPGSWPHLDERYLEGRRRHILEEPFGKGVGLSKDADADPPRYPPFEGGWVSSVKKDLNGIGIFNKMLGMIRLNHWVVPASNNS